MDPISIACILAGIERQAVSHLSIKPNGDVALVDNIGRKFTFTVAQIQAKRSYMAAYAPTPTKTPRPIITPPPAPPAPPTPHDKPTRRRK